MQYTTYLDIESPSDLDFSRQPALRAWGDALLELCCQREGLTPTPDITVRRRALFCWLTDPTADRFAGMAHRRRFEIEIDPGACAVARADLVDSLFNHTTWAGFHIHAMESGFDGEFVDEELVPISSPRGTSIVDATAGVLAAVDNSLLDLLMDYVRIPCLNYLASWTSFDPEAPSPNEPNWELVVPETAFLSISD